MDRLCGSECGREGMRTVGTYTGGGGGVLHHQLRYSRYAEEKQS